MRTGGQTGFRWCQGTHTPLRKWSVEENGEVVGVRVHILEASGDMLEPTLLLNGSTSEEQNMLDCSQLWYTWLSLIIMM